MIEQAEKLGASHITFLPLDYSSDTSFARTQSPDLLKNIPNRAEVAQMTDLVTELTDTAYIMSHPVLREEGADLLRVLEYYETANGLRESINPRCNTPKTNIIIDAYGNINLCFFTESVGSLTTASVHDVLTSPKATQMKQLVQDQMLERCRGCVCPVEYSASPITYNPARSDYTDE